MLASYLYFLFLGSKCSKNAEFFNQCKFWEKILPKPTFGSYLYNILQKVVLVQVHLLYLLSGVSYCDFKQYILAI